jgi:hypothetical protein
MTGVSLERLRILELSNLALCTQLPNGLCELPYLEILIVLHAPAIKHVGPELMRHTHKHNNKRHSRVSVSFPSLKNLIFIEMVRWEEWEWDCEELLEAMQITDTTSTWTFLPCKGAQDVEPSRCSLPSLSGKPSLCR